MAQPVIDTLQVADALQRSGMDREQAEGVARTLGTQLGDHVAARKDLDLGFERILARVDERFAHVDQRFAQVDDRFAELRGEIKSLHSKFNVLGVGVASVLAFLGVIVGFLGVISGLDRLV